MIYHHRGHSYFRFFVQLYRSWCTPGAVAGEPSSCSQVKTRSTHPSRAEQLGQGRAVLKPGRGELQLPCAAGSGGAAQEGERELNPGVTGGLS